jgi:sulfur-oxidizing protein SoxZ
MTARIQVPETAKRGEVLEVRLLVQHPMETGYRYDDTGKPIPRNVITRLVCRFAGREVLRADMTQGIAANPYLQFYLRAQASGELEFEWQDDEGVRGTERRRIEVTA